MIFLDSSDVDVMVDRVSFAVMRRRGLTTVFSYDEHFRQEGFTLVGSS